MYPDTESLLLQSLQKGMSLYCKSHVCMVQVDTESFAVAVTTQDGACSYGITALLALCEEQKLKWR